MVVMPVTVIGVVAVVGSSWCVWHVGAYISDQAYESRMTIPALCVGADEHESTTLVWMHGL